MLIIPIPRGTPRAAIGMIVFPIIVVIVICAAVATRISGHRYCRSEFPSGTRPEERYKPGGGQFGYAEARIQEKVFQFPEAKKMSDTVEDTIT